LQASAWETAATPHLRLVIAVCSVSTCTKPLKGHSSCEARADIVYKYSLAIQAKACQHESSDTGKLPEKNPTGPKTRAWCKNIIYVIGTDLGNKKKKHLSMK